MGKNRKPLDVLRQAPLVEEKLKSLPAGPLREKLLAVRMGFDLSNSLADIAQTMNRATSTIQEWFDAYRQGGIAALEQDGRGKTPKPDRLGAAAREGLQKQLQAGTARRIEDLRQYLIREHGVELPYSTMARVVKKSNGVRRVPRPRHVGHNELNASQFKAQLAEKLSALEVPVERRVRVWMADEARFGLHSFTRSVWVTKGVRPIAASHASYTWGYLYGAVEVLGQHAAEFLHTPTVNLNWTEEFMDQIRRTDPDSEHIIIYDGAGFHPKHSAHAKVPEGVHVLVLPPYSPELNPIEKLWDQLKDSLCNQAWPSLDKLQRTINPWLTSFWSDPRRTQSLIGSGWLPLQVNAISPVDLPL